MPRPSEGMAQPFAQLLRDATSAKAKPLGADPPPKAAGRPDGHAGSHSEAQCHAGHIPWPAVTALEPKAVEHNHTHADATVVVATLLAGDIW